VVRVTWRQLDDPTTLLADLRHRGRLRARRRLALGPGSCARRWGSRCATWPSAAG
jgi:hypothetical protein